MTKVAAVLVRGTIGSSAAVRTTLLRLRLLRKNTCVVLDATPEVIGMLIRVKDYITWGEVHEKTLALLFERRGRLAGNKPVTSAYLKEHAKHADFSSLAGALVGGKVAFKDLPGLKPYFRLQPPRMGFGYAGIKQPFTLGGALGYRKDAINALLEKMM